jgi:hypothetical protein
MTSRLSWLLNLGLVAAIALSGLVVQAPAASGTAGPATAPIVSISPPGAARLKNRHRDGKRERGADRGHENKKKHRNQTNSSAPDSWPDKGPTQGDPAGKNGDEQDGDAGRTGKWRDYCAGAASEKLPQVDQCTHGPDPAPPGYRVDRSVDAEPAAAAVGDTPNDTPGIVCQGDGSSGNRVQVLYVRTPVVNRYSKFLGSFRRWAIDADQIFQTSAAETGGTRNLRFVHDDSCQIDVLNVTVAATAINSFNATIGQLRNQGFNRTDRIYLIFADTTTSGICGIGTIWRDERPGTENWNNFGPSYARADAGCWSGYVAAHELMHNLGGVQLSAPNSSGGFHCIDEYDVMCYSDTPNRPTMRYDCPTGSLDTTRFDCGDDDYYNTNPAPASYLANNWNPANNQFLIAGGEADPPPVPPTQDRTAPAVRWTAPVGNDQTQAVTTGIVALAATASDNVGVERVEFWRFDAASVDWVLLGTDATAPYEASIDAGSLGEGLTYLSADAYDAAGNWSYKQIALDRSPSVSPPPQDNPTPSPPPDEKKPKKHKKHKHKHKHKRRH